MTPDKKTSNKTSSSPSATPLTAPTGLTAIRVGSARINLLWNINPQTQKIDHYNIYRDTKPNFDVKTADPPTEKVISTSYVDTGANKGLKPSTTYYYKVAAVQSLDGADAIGLLSEEASATTASSPSEVKSVTAISIDNTKINLRWTSNPPEEDIDHYEIYRDTCSGFSVDPTKPLVTMLNNSYDDMALKPSTTYYYKVRAVQAGGNAGEYSEEASATTAASIEVSDIYYEYMTINTFKEWSSEELEKFVSSVNIIYRIYSVLHMVNNNELHEKTLDIVLNQLSRFDSLKKLREWKDVFDAITPVYRGFRQDQTHLITNVFTKIFFDILAEYMRDEERLLIRSVTMRSPGYIKFFTRRRIKRSDNDNISDEPQKSPLTKTEDFVKTTLRQEENIEGKLMQENRIADPRMLALTSDILYGEPKEIISKLGKSGKIGIMD